MRLLITVLSLLIFIPVSAQTSLESIQPHEEYENLLVKKLYSDSLSSTFVIWVKNGVKAHRHVVHTETIYVLEGEGKFKLGDEAMMLKPGDLFTIPMNVVHSLVVTRGPMKVISVQSPEFLGKDRVWEE